MGMIVAALAFPVHSLFYFLFSKAHSQVSGGDVKLCYSHEVMKGTWSVLDFLCLLFYSISKKFLGDFSALPYEPPACC